MEAFAPTTPGRSGAPPERSPTGLRPPVLTVGTVVWLASELMFFSGLFAAYFTLRSSADGPWPPPGSDLDARVAGLFTLALVASSGTVQLAVRSLAAGRRGRFRAWIVATVVLAAVFLANQAREWATSSFSASSHSFGSAFFVLTGFHGLHVAGGVVAMLFLLGRARGRGGRAPEALALLPSAEVVSYYWHFVDVVWLGLYATLFLFR